MRTIVDKIFLKVQSGELKDKFIEFPWSNVAEYEKFSKYFKSMTMVQEDGRKYAEITLKEDLPQETMELLKSLFE